MQQHVLGNIIDEQVVDALLQKQIRVTLPQTKSEKQIDFIHQFKLFSKGCCGLLAK
jgi:hypothetical protein